MDYKKLFGNATKFVNEYNITTSASRPRASFSGMFLFPGQAETKDAKYVMLHEPKTKNLEWISKVFPKVEYLTIFYSRKNYKSKLENITSLKKLKNLKYLQILDVHINEIEVDMQCIEFFELTAYPPKSYERDQRNDKKILVNLCNPSEKIIYYRIVSDNLTGNPEVGITVNNLSYLSKIKSGDIYLICLLDEKEQFLLHLTDLYELKKLF